MGESVDEPGSGHARHPTADEGDALAAEVKPEVTMAERAPSMGEAPARAVHLDTWGRIGAKVSGLLGVRRRVQGSLAIHLVFALSRSQWQFFLVPGVRYGNALLRWQRARKLAPILVDRRIWLFAV